MYGTLFINYRHLPPFLALFLKSELYPEVEFLSSLCRNSLLSLQVDNQKFTLNGLSQPETLPGSLFHQFKTLKTTHSRLPYLIPDRTAILFHFGEEQLAAGFKNQEEGAAQFTPEVAPLLDSLRGNFKQELAICYLAAANQNTTPDKIVLAYSPKPNQVKNLIQELNQVITTTTFPAKRAGRYQIQEVGVPELPLQLFGKGFKGFQRCFVAQADSFMLFAASEEALRGYLQNIRDKKIWSNSTAQQNFQQQGLSKTNLGFYLNTNNAWNILNRYLLEDKQVGLLRHERFLKKMNQLSWQYASSKKQFITRILLQHQPPTTSPQQLKQVFEQEQEIAFAAPLTSGPALFSNPSGVGNRILIQDSAQVLHQITPDGRVTWSDSLDNKLTSSIYPVNLGSGAQPKYVFSTRNRIYCLDQDGNDLENFPFNLSDTTLIQNLTVINRGANNPHFLVNDAANNVYLYDQQGNLLPGWEPREMPGKLALAPYYLQVKGREVFVLVLENGYTYAVDRNGANYPGFPINLKGKVTAPLIAQPGTSFRNTRLVLLNEAGELITFNLAGEVEKRMAFARPSRRTTFHLIPENSGKSFLVARQDLGRVTLYDADQKLIMEKNFVTSAPKLIQYFYFDPANIIYAITERGPQKTYLYDINIKLIGTGPVTNQWPVQLDYNSMQQQFQLFVTHDNTLQNFTFRTRP